MSSRAGTRRCTTQTCPLSGGMTWTEEAMQRPMRGRMSCWGLEGTTQGTLGMVEALGTRSQKTRQGSGEGGMGEGKQDKVPGRVGRAHQMCPVGLVSTWQLCGLCHCPERAGLACGGMSTFFCVCSLGHTCREQVFLLIKT